MSRRVSLLTQLHRLIETSYDWNTGVGDVARFVIGDEGYRHLYRGREILGEFPGGVPGPQTLVCWQGPEIRLRVYLPDDLVRLLEQRNPLHQLDEENLPAFSALVEELDHLLRLAWCVRTRRPVRLLELEFHANVTKYLVLAHFLGRHSRRARLTSGQRRWLLDRLFLGAGDDLPEGQAERYRLAARLARRFLDYLDSQRVHYRVAALRRLPRRSWERVLECLGSPERDERLAYLLGG